MKSVRCSSNISSGEKYGPSWKGGGPSSQGSEGSAGIARELQGAEAACSEGDSECTSFQNVDFIARLVSNKE